MNGRSPVCVVIPTRDRRSDLLDCLASVVALDRPAAEVIVVDNASSDGTAQALAEHFPDVTCLQMSHNTGFTGGCNHGLQYARRREANAVLLLNDDAVVAPDALRHLMSVLEQIPDAGMVGPTIYFHDRPEVIWSAGGTIDWRRGHTRLLDLDSHDHGQLGTLPRPVDYVSGCCLLVRTKLLDRIGGLDPRFFAYYEEVEWCVRAQRAGARVYHVPVAHAWHKIDPRRQADSPIVYYYMTRNRLLFLSLTHAPMAAWCRVMIENLRTLASWSLRPKWRHRRPQRRVLLRAWSDFLRRRWGAAEGVT